MVPKKNYKPTDTKCLQFAKNKGFTLIEVLIAFAILSSLLVVILQSYSDTSSFLQRTRLKETAQRTTFYELSKIERQGLDSFTNKSGQFPEEHELAGGSWKIIESKETFMEVIPVTKVTYHITWQNGIYSNSYKSSILIK
ncbi:MAG: type II secretion system protein [Deltaproteobacteria bacterium]|nr:type II secretion system protein [Deltaproteobacteria bacterium]MBT4525099.1 type II secretion system protein [Deltaproteobacteria bacterium]